MIPADVPQISARASRHRSYTVTLGPFCDLPSAIKVAFGIYRVKFRWVSKSTLSVQSSGPPFFYRICLPSHPCPQASLSQATQIPVSQNGARRAVPSPCAPAQGQACPSCHYLSSHSSSPQPAHCPLANTHQLSPLYCFIALNEFFSLKERKKQ